jgi:hypothetical protein
MPDDPTFVVVFVQSFPTTLISKYGSTLTGVDVFSTSTTCADELIFATDLNTDANKKNA